MTGSPNVELVRSIIEAWERGDYSSAEWAHPEIEYVFAERPLDGIGRAGRGGPRLSRRGQDYRIEVDEDRELDDERVLALVHHSGRGKTSGVELGQVGTQGARLFRLRGGKVTTLVIYFDREAPSPTSASIRRPARPTRLTERRQRAGSAAPAG